MVLIKKISEGVTLDSHGGEGHPSPDPAQVFLTLPNIFDAPPPLVIE